MRLAWDSLTSPDAFIVRISDIRKRHRSSLWRCRSSHDLGKAKRPFQHGERGISLPLTKKLQTCGLRINGGGAVVFAAFCSALSFLPLIAACRLAIRCLISSARDRGVGAASSSCFSASISLSAALLSLIIEVNPSLRHRFPYNQLYVPV